MGVRGGKHLDWFLRWVATCVEWCIRVRVVGDPPEFEDRAGDQFFGRLCDTGRFDLVWTRTRIRWWVVVF